MKLMTSQNIISFIIHFLNKQILLFFVVWNLHQFFCRTPTSQLTHLHISQHLHNEITLQLSKSLNKVVCRHSVVFSQQSSSTCCRPRCTRRRAREGFPSLPAPPTACIYASTSLGAPKCMMLRTLGTSTPIPKATVAMTIRRGDDIEVNASIIWSLIIVSVQLVNMSTSLNWVMLGASIGQVKYSPSRLWKNKYKFAQSSQKIIVFPKLVNSVWSWSAIGPNVLISLSNGFTESRKL